MTAPTQCFKCGRFIGPGGEIDILYDSYFGAYEEGYSRCESCIGGPPDPIQCGLCGSPPSRSGTRCSNKECRRAWKSEKDWESYLNLRRRALKVRSILKETNDNTI